MSGLPLDREFRGCGGGYHAEHHRFPRGEMILSLLPDKFQIDLMLVDFHVARLLKFRQTPLRQIEDTPKNQDVPDDYEQRKKWQQRDVRHHHTRPLFC
jgi:hypothetical protein